MAIRAPDGANNEEEKMFQNSGVVVELDLVD